MVSWWLDNDFGNDFVQRIDLSLNNLDFGQNFEIIEFCQKLS